jgi:hypothetical protein
MSKPAAPTERRGVLERPFEPFYGSPLPIGTECAITNEDEERYIVKFPGRVGYSGTHHIKRIYVKEI